MFYVGKLLSTLPPSLVHRLAPLSCSSCDVKSLTFPSHHISDIGLLEGADRTFGGFLLHNLIPVTLGNFVGGGLFLGVAQWVTYDTGRTTPSTRGNSYISGRPNDEDGGLEAGVGDDTRQSLIPVGSINTGDEKGNRLW